MTNTTDTTATRVQKGKAVKVVLTFPDGTSHTVGGNRAARCNFAVVAEENHTHCHHEDWIVNKADFLGFGDTEAGSVWTEEETYDIIRNDSPRWQNKASVYGEPYDHHYDAQPCRAGWGFVGLRSAYDAAVREAEKFASLSRIARVEVVAIPELEVTA